MNRKKPSKNLFNAKTGRVIKKQVGSWEPSGVRSNMDGTGIHIGLGYSNYYIPSMVKAYEIFDDNSLTVTSADDYGVAFEFILEQGATYTLSYNYDSSCGVNVLLYDKNGAFIKTISASNRVAFTIPTNAYFAVINFLHYKSQTNGVPATTTFTNIQLEKGNVATEFEPYRK